MGSFASESAADICILGSGIAGMLLAERLLARAPGRRILMVERGTTPSHQERLKRGTHDDPLAFNRSPLRLPHVPPPLGPRTRWDRQYVYWPVYNLGGCTNHFFGNVPRFHPSHFEQDGFGGADRAWPIRYPDLEPYYLQAEQRLRVAGNSEKTPFQGSFAYPLPPHRLSPSDRACETIFGHGSVVQVPTTRASQAVDGRAPCCATNKCDLCPVDAKGHALNTVYPSIRDRVELRSGLLATELQCRQGRVVSATAVDGEGKHHRIDADVFVVACNGVDSCLLLQRSPTVPQLPALGRHFMDHPVFEVAIYDSGLETRPGYGDSAQTGMLLTFFERAGADLPISMLGEIRPAAFSLNAGEMTRDVLVRDLIQHAMATRGRESFRERFGHAWSGALDLYFVVEVQPRPDHRVSLDRIEPTGQPIPRVEQEYPPYFGGCVERVLARIRERLPRSAVAKHVSTFPTSFHWLGAIRMSERDVTGCVDRTLKYYGLENLRILSTGVFASSSSANPTLTLAALALRLGDDLA